MTTNVKAVRSVRKLEKPRPLKFLSTQSNRQTIADASCLRTKTTAESVLQDLETLAKHINNGNYDSSLSTVVPQLCSDLKLYGSQLDAKYKDQVDRHFVSLRNGSRDVRLDIVSRTMLLEVIELRAMQWQTNENINNYYRDKLAQAATIPAQRQQPLTPTFQNVNTSSLILPNSAPTSLFYVNNNPAISPLSQQSVLAPGEIIKSSGKYVQPTRVPGKNYFKDEVIIRNADSGKVMGIKGRRVHMIEELSETIISFQRVNPGAKDRLVQITGPNDDSIENAKQLIEQTICRNASPIRDKLESGDFGSDTSLNTAFSDDPSQFPVGGRGVLVHSFSMNDATGLGDYKYSVAVGSDKINITGPNLDLVRTAKLILDEYFNNDHDGVFTDEDIDSPTFFTAQHPRDEGERITRWVQNAKPLCSDSDSPRSSGVASDDTYIATEKMPVFSRTLSGEQMHLRSAKFLPGYSNLNPEAPDFSVSSKKDSIQKKQIVYSRDFLLKCASSPASQETPEGWDQVCKDLPNVTKKHGDAFDPTELLKKLPKLSPGVLRQSSPRSDEGN